MKQSNEKRNHALRALAVVLAVACVLAAARASWAWLTRERAVVAVARVDAPMSLLINAGNAEDKQYLDLSNIDVNDSGHEEFVFAVSGAYVNQFKLQLAYTTNNEFTYQIYPAVSCAQAEAEVTYFSRQRYAAGETPYEFYYKRAPGAAAYSMTARNPKDGTSVRLAAPDGNSGDVDDLYDRTYGDYANVDAYAVPMYWQTGLIQVGEGDAVPGQSYAFVKYFILQVNWETTGDDKRSNDRETDMIYIAAKKF